MAKNNGGPPVPVWKGANYTRVREGRYQAIAVRYQGPDWIRAFARWSLLVQFELLDDGSLVCAFYNMGNDRNAPQVMRRGRFFAAWTLANGEMPRKREAMTAEVFLEGQVFIVEVKDSRRNAKEQEKADAEIYSKVTEIVSVSQAPNPESFNQESRIREPTNQAINQSGLASSQMSNLQRPQSSP